MHAFFAHQQHTGLLLEWMKEIPVLAFEYGVVDIFTFMFIVPDEYILRLHGSIFDKGIVMCTCFSDAEHL